MTFFAVDTAQAAAAITAAAAAIATLYGVYRSARKDRSNDIAGGAAVLLGGWAEFQASTRKEVEFVRQSLQQQIADLKAEQAFEREEWVKDSAAKQLEIDKLKAQIFILLEGKNR